MRGSYGEVAQYAAYLREGKARAAGGEDLSGWLQAHPHLETTLAFLDSALACAATITSDLDRGMFLACIDAAMKRLK